MGGGPKDVLLVTMPFPERKDLVEHMVKKFPGLEVIWHAPEEKQVPDELFKSATIIVTFNKLPRTPSLAPNLSLVHFASAGINHVATHPIFTSTKIPLTTSNGVHGPQIAEWVLMTALVQNHRYNHYHDMQKEKKWSGFGDNRVRDWVGAKVGILGYGSIGRQVARAFTSLGTTIHAYTAHPRPTPSSRRDNGYIVPNTGDPDGSFPSTWHSGTDKASLHTFLALELDVIVLCLPLTPSSTHLLGKDEFELLGKQARPPLVSNISRGDIVDQDAMVDALYAGKLRGACLDVASPEPLPKESRLWEAPNTVITPHISGDSALYAERTWEILERNLGKREKGEALINLVDRRRGY